MKNFKVILTRDFILKIKAKNGRQAKNLAGHFISQGIDALNENERQKKKFKIVDFDLAANDDFGSAIYEENN